MRTRYLGAALVALAVFFAVDRAMANWLTAIPESIARDFKRRNCWPRPFSGPDRDAVQAPFTVMVANGWMRQNTLGDHHFLPETGELTEAGKLKVQWIVREAPSQHRAIFVYRSIDAQETQARMNAVAQLAAELAVDGSAPPPVLASNAAPSGWPAERVDAVGRKFQATTPDPRLPEPQRDGQ